MTTETKRFQPLDGSLADKPAPPIEDGLTSDSQRDWTKLQQLTPLNTGPRMLYVLVDAPLLRHRLAELLSDSLQQQGLAIMWLDFSEPYYQPLQEIFDQAAQHPDARFFFLFGLERSLLSTKHRMSALTDLNFHRDQISKRLPGPLLIWIPDETFTDLLINAPDFAAWRGGVFKLRDEASEREAPYRQYIIDQFGKLTLYSTTADAPLAVDLEQVFVKLTTVQRKKPVFFVFTAPAFAEGGAAGTRVTSYPEASIESSENSFERLGREPVEETIVTLSLSEALRHQYLAVIGAPGSGKTTLLKYLALSFARRQARERLELTEDRLPILVYLRDFGPFLDAAPQQEDGAALLLHFLSEQYQKTAAYLNLPGDFFSQRLEAGRCIVLLDGLDEVIDPVKREHVLNMIVALASRYGANRFVVTSRPRSYESDAKQRLAPLYAECAIRDFDDDDMSAFARSWYTTVTVDRRGDTVAAREAAVTQAEDLLRAIRADERIKTLAHNPLLLSVLAMVHQRGVGLPQRRAELYDECTDMLLGYWDQTKGGEAARTLANLGFLNRTEKRALLEPIALWFHERGEHGLEATKEELEEQITEQFTAIFGDTTEKARERATVFLGVIDKRAGLLVERVTGVYAFAHLTFQEYLAARAIADREDYIDYTLKRLHKPWWREVLLLEVGHLSDQRYFGRRTRKLTSDLIVAVRNAGSWLEDILKRDFLFAARCLSDIGQLGADDQVRQSSMDELIALWESTPYQPQRWQVETIFVYAIPTRDGARICAELLSHLAGQNENTRKAAADALGRLGSAAATPAVLDRLLTLLTDPDNGVRWAAALGLGRLGGAAATPSVLERLLALSQDQVADVRKAAADALGRLGSAAATPAVLDRLLTLLTDPDNGVRWAAALGLGRLGGAAATPSVLERLLALSQDQVADVRKAAVNALGHLGGAAATPSVLERLLTLIADRESAVSMPATLALGLLGSAAATPSVLERLLALIENQDSAVSAALALGLLGSAAATPSVLGRLLALIENQDNTFYVPVVLALSSLRSAAATPSVLERLLALVIDQDNVVRRLAFRVLGSLGSAAATPSVLERLLALSRAQVDEVRQAAAEALGHLGSAAATSTVLESLLTLSHDPETEIRSSAAKALGNLGSAAATSPVLDRLLALSQDQATDVRKAAVEALDALGSTATTPPVLNRLVALSRDQEDGVRKAVAVALGSLGNAATMPLVLERLIELTHDQVRDVREAAIVALSRLEVPPSAFNVLTEFWSSQLKIQDDEEVLGDQLGFIRSLAYEQLQRLAELRELQATKDETTPGQ